MEQTMYIDPKGRHKLRRVMRGTRCVAARIEKAEDGARIVFSDGRSAILTKEPQVSADTFTAAVMQWARRRGATTFEIAFR